MLALISGDCHGASERGKGHDCMSHGAFDLLPLSCDERFRDVATNHVAMLRGSRWCHVAMELVSRMSSPCCGEELREGVMLALIGGDCHGASERVKDHDSMSHGALDLLPLSCDERTRHVAWNNV